MKTSMFIAAVIAAVAGAPQIAAADTTVVVRPGVSEPAPPPTPPTGAVVVTPAEPASPSVQSCTETTTKSEDLAGSTTERRKTCVESGSTGN